MPPFDTVPESIGQPAAGSVPCPPQRHLANDPESSQLIGGHVSPASNRLPRFPEDLPSAVPSDAGVYPTSNSLVTTVPQALPSPLSLLSEIRMSLLSYAALSTYDCPVSPGQTVQAAQSLNQLASPTAASPRVTSHPDTRGYADYAAEAPPFSAVGPECCPVSKGPAMLPTRPSYQLNSPAISRSHVMSHPGSVRLAAPARAVQPEVEQQLLAVYRLEGIPCLGTIHELEHLYNLSPGLAKVGSPGLV